MFDGSIHIYFNFKEKNIFEFHALGISHLQSFLESERLESKREQEWALFVIYVIYT